MISTFFPSQQTFRSVLGIGAITLAVLTSSTSLHAQGYTVTPLVGDASFGSNLIDTNLINAWGLVVLPDNSFIVNANGTSLAGMYDANGTPTGDYLEVDFDPSGLALNKGAGFAVSNGGKAQPSSLIFSSEDGTLLGWSPKLNSSAAVVAVDNSEFGAVYKGVAVLGSKLFAADFRNGVVDVYNNKWQWLGAFTDSEVDPGFGPFNVVAINGFLYVSFAKILPPEFRDDEAGPGNGYVDVFDANGNFVKRLVSHGALNSPWGMAIAPKNFGALSGDLLVGNFGDGTINAYNPKTGAFAGTVSDSGGHAIVIDGLWGIDFGTKKVSKKSVPVLYFSAGPNGENDGVVGTLQANTP